MTVSPKKQQRTAKPRRTRIGLSTAALYAGILAGMAGCSVLQSPYALSPDAKKWFRKEDQSQCSAQVYACTDQPGMAAQCIENQFEHALYEHATFSSLTGEALIPLAAIVGYRAMYKNGRNPKALAAGGLALYGISSYAYSKPREAIYLTGVSALECAQRLADVQRLDAESAAELRGIAGGPNTDTKHDDAYREGIALRSNADVGSATFAASTALKSLKNFSAACNRTESVKLAGKAQARSTARQAKLHELSSRLQTTQNAARALLAADREADRQLCRVSNRIRVDVNHMLEAQSADPAALAKSLSVFSIGKSQQIAPTGMTGTAETAALAGAADAGSDTPHNAHAADHCDADAKDLVRMETEADAALKATQAAIEQIELQISLAHAGPLDEDALLNQCGVQSVAIPSAFVVSATDTVQIAQGGTIQVPVSGGRTPYHALVGNPPKTGKLLAQIGGDATIGYNVKVSASTDATPSGDTYMIVVTDNAGGAQTVSAKVVAKPN